MNESGGDLHAIEREMVSVEAIRQVIGAVWTLARAQQQRTETAATDAAAYLSWVEALVSRFAVNRLDEEPGAALWVVLGPERPFCGGLARRLIEQFPSTGELLLVGRRLADAVPITSSIHHRIIASLPAAAAPEEIDSCARLVAEKLLELNHPGPIGLLHPAAGEAGLVRTPLVGAFLRDSRHLPETFSPARRILSAALHEAVAGRLSVGAAEALRSEVRARLMAAEAARQGADRKLDDLRQRWRVERQESITSELLELYSGRLGNSA